MNIVCIGGGPAGLYFGILIKKANPAHLVRVIERNRHDDTFGFGVVFSDATLGNLAAADPETYARVTEEFAHWDDIDTHIGDRVIRSTGHGFCGLSRQKLLLILQERCRELGVSLQFETEVHDLGQLSDADLIVAADGVGSQIRGAHADGFEPTVNLRPNRFVWLGTTYPFQAFTFYFKRNHHGLFRVHAYRYQQDGSTFIVECTEDTWRRAGLDETSEDRTIEYLEALFADELAGHRLIKNRSIWRQFPTVSNRRWHHENIVLVGDAVHTAHFSIGSGTKLAMEDCIDLCAAISELDDKTLTPAALDAALTRYEDRRRPEVEKWQTAAQVSLEWFENTERYMHLPPEQFTFSLLTRSLRVTHANLKLRDPELTGAFDAFYARQSGKQARVHHLDRPENAPPPMLTPFRTRTLVVDNRVVALSARLDRARDGVVGDAHLVHLGSLARGGAGLIMTEPAAVAPEGMFSLGAVGMFSDACADGYRRIVDFIHDETDAKICVTLGHAGRRARGLSRRLLPVSASAIPYEVCGTIPRLLETLDVGPMRDAWVLAAKRAAAVGFDMLTIDMSGGGLLASFLSPLTNTRQDDYGGSLDNRLRFPLRLVKAIRDTWPESKPLSARISATDWAPVGKVGLSGADAVVIARALSKAGCDLIEVTTGGNLQDEQPAYGRLYQTQFADRVRNEARVATIAIDDIASFTDINSVLLAGRADLCAPTRMLLHDPSYVRRVAATQGHPLDWPDSHRHLRGFVTRDR